MENIMWIRRKFVTVCIFAVLLLGCVMPAHAADPCDRACLEGYIDKVLSAMIAHNPN
jgi:hypothetical protein